MTAEVWLAVPGDPETLTGGYIYAARLAQALTTAGWTVHRLRLPESFPHPTSADLDATHAVLVGVPAGAAVIIDGLAFGTFPGRVFDGLDLDIVALVHHPLAYETGITPEQAAHFLQTESIALRYARAVIATSPYTAVDLVESFDVPHGKVTVALPGIATPEVVPEHKLKPIPSLLTVATITPRKGFDVLVPALADIKDMPWRATWVGSTTRSPATTEALRKEITQCGLGVRITLAGETPTLAPFYAEADVFVLPSRYEGYGMAFAEALAYGLPVIGCRAGAVGDTVPDDAGILVPPDDTEALAQALRTLLGDAALYARLAAGARRAGARFARWDDTARIVASVLTA